MAKKKSKGAARLTGSDRMFRIVVTILVVILLIMIATFAHQLFRNIKKDVTSPGDFYRDFQYGHYSYTIDYANKNIAVGETGSKYDEVYGAVDYLEAELKYVGFTRAAEQASAAGDAEDSAAMTALADEMKAEMDRATEEMGEISFLAEDFDKVFGLDAVPLVSGEVEE